MGTKIVAVKQNRIKDGLLWNTTFSSLMLSGLPQINIKRCTGGRDRLKLTKVKTVCDVSAQLVNPQQLQLQLQLHQQKKRSDLSQKQPWYCTTLQEVCSTQCLMPGCILQETITYLDI